MEVRLIDYQENALELLLYTKSTRLQGEGLSAIEEWPMEKKLEHLDYMRDTIKSSWEFATYMFEIKGVTRAFTHQLVRTRTASFAQETQRALDVRDASFKVPAGYNEKQTTNFALTMEHSLHEYADLVDDGMKPQDARGVIPTNIHTSIIMGANLRTLHETAKIRLCTRTQGEYQDVFRLMRDEVLKVHPWAEDFIQVHCVSEGTCCFPRYKECPFQKFTANGQYDMTELKQQVKELFWNIRHEASPKVWQDGTTSDGKEQLK